MSERGGTPAIPGYLRSRAYRLSRVDQRARERRMNAARQRALVRLRRLYPDDFRRLYLNELEAAGVTGPCTQSGGGESDA